MTAMTLTPQQCREELDRVLASAEFARAEQLRTLLQWLCLRRLETPSAPFTQYDIGIGCLGRKKEFDPHFDPVVRKETARLRKRLDTHYASLPAPPPCRILIQPGTYLPQWIAASPVATAARSHARLLVLPFEFLSPSPEPGLADAFSISLMADLSAHPGVEVGPRYLALLARHHAPAGFHYLVEGVLERRHATLHAQAWLVQGQRAFLQYTAVSASTFPELASLLTACFVGFLKNRTLE
jgi:hypothetical protein